MRKFFYSLKQAGTQIKRNKGMALTSVFAISAMLIILGLFFMVIVNINTVAEVVKQDYNNIEVFFEEDLPEHEAREKVSEVEKWENVDSVTFRTKDEALKILKGRWGENAYLLDGLSQNPLPNSIVITVDNLEDSDSVAEKAEKIEHVEDVKYYKDTVNKLVKATKAFQIAAFVIMGFLIIISTVVVSNTIKLTVFNRSDEIVIMKYIGATNWFIRAPFLIEGIIIGMISALIASGIVSLIYNSIVSVIGESVLSIMSVSMVPVGFVAFNLIIIFITLGVSIGAWGSIISMRRFLDK